jgi:hypothetical protein
MHVDRDEDAKVHLHDGKLRSTVFQKQTPSMARLRNAPVALRVASCIAVTSALPPLPSTVGGVVAVMLLWTPPDRKTPAA